MKKFLLLLILAIPLMTDKPVMLASFGFEFGEFKFGISGTGGGSPAATYNLLKEDADAFLLENGDNILLESAP